MSWTSKAKESQFARDVNGNLLIRDAVIMQGRNANGNWSNFSGREKKVNPHGGKRTFNVVLPEDVAMELRSEGWNIKMMQPRDDQEDVLYFTEIVLNMEKKVEPDVYLCTEWAGKKKKTRLHGDDVGQLDDIRFARADVPKHLLLRRFPDERLPLLVGRGLLRIRSSPFDPERLRIGESGSA